MYQIVILAGGLATRLRPITEIVPKSLVEINGQPFIFHQLKLLKSKGITKVLICTGYLGNKIEKLVGNGKMLDMEISYSYDGDVLLGTGGAIKNASSLLEEKFMITYGDSYLDFDYASLEKTFEKTNYSAMMTIFKNNDNFDKSNVIFEDGKLKLYSKSTHSHSMHYIDYGLTIVRKSIFDNIKKGDIFDFSIILETLSNKNELGAFEVPKRFYEIGSFQGIKDLEYYLKIIN